MMSQVPESRYRISVATTKEELEAVYRLRYEVFFEEGGDARYADHNLKHWRDEDDGEFSKTLICQGNDGTTYGTMRLTLLRDHQFIAQEAYLWPQLSSLVGIEEFHLRTSAARFDRAVVALSMRRSRVFIKLFERIKEMAIESSVLIMVGAASVGNSIQNRLWGKLGWKPYQEVESHSFRATVYYFDLRDETLD